MAQIEATEYKAKEGEYYKVGEVFQATVGYQHYGVWTSKEDAEAHIKANVPDAVPFTGVPSALKPLPDGQYYIQPRSLFSHQKPTV